MRHQQKGRKFGRIKGKRVAFLKGLAINLIEKEAIVTTDARAKELRPIIEKHITLARKGTLAGLRLLVARLSKKAAMKLFYDIAPRYKERAGGYTRIVKLSGQRVGDAAKKSRIEFV